MKYFILILAIFSSATFAKVTDRCNEAVTLDLIKYLEQKDPEAQLSLVFNQSEKIIGITDNSGLNPDIDLLQIKTAGKDLQINQYGFDNVTFTLKYTTFTSAGVLSCKVISIEKIIED